jgi:drug/metabolite transporter superfamily protein YnfA
MIRSGSNHRRAITVDDVRTTVVFILVVFGILVALAGSLFALQGFGVVHGSPMTNTTTWSILGPIIALIGIAIVLAGWRLHKP